MDFTMSARQRQWLERVQAFMNKHVRPAVQIYDEQDAEGPRWKIHTGYRGIEGQGEGRGSLEHVHAAVRA